MVYSVFIEYILLDASLNTKCNSEPNALELKAVVARVCFLLAKRQKPNDENDDKFEGFTSPQNLSGFVNEVHRETKREPVYTAPVLFISGLNPMENG